MLVEVSNESGAEVDEAALMKQASFMMQALHLNRSCELSIALVDTETMEKLHLQHMDEPGPTDVLSFPMDDIRAGTTQHPSSEGVLGDVVICPQVAANQAITAGHSKQDELTLLLTHGILHLLGHDHAEPDEHKVMFDLQAQLIEQWHASRSEN